MKIKQTPDDFIVEELDEYMVNQNGKYALYKLTKFGITLIDTINSIAKLFDVPKSSIDFGGIKDRYAKSTQIVSIKEGPKKDLIHSNFTLRYISNSLNPIKKTSFSKNFFRITIRDLIKSDIKKIYQGVDQILKYGCPNYFDEQRFGSLRGCNEFIAKRLILKDFENALKIAICSFSRQDRKKKKDIRKKINKLWGEWNRIEQHIPKNCMETKIIKFLKDHPHNFAKAFELLDAKLRNLYLCAYQSYLWNRCLSEIITQNCPPDEIIPYKSKILGKIVFYKTLDNKTNSFLSNLEIPLLTKTTQFNENIVQHTMQKILQSEGITQKDLRLKKLKKTYFKKAQRKAIVRPEDFCIDDATDDELNEGKSKVILSFKLPKGSYATILIKRLLPAYKTRTERLQ
jgi:tRNA pseudouridine13 synthase